MCIFREMKSFKFEKSIFATFLFSWCLLWIIPSGNASILSKHATYDDTLTHFSDKVHDYLMEFGYLPKSDIETGNLRTEVQLKEAIKSLQKFGNIPETGIIDKKTAELLRKPRCGVPDQPEAPDFTPDNRSGNRRSKRFVIQGPKWHQTNLTWSLVNQTMSTLDAGQVRRVLTEALSVWSRNSKLTFQEIYSEHADIQVLFARKHHGDGYDFDGPGKVLAHAFYPGSGRGGDAHFDDEENWFLNGSHSSEGANLMGVAVHEFGHSLGLGHSSVEEAIMFPWYHGNNYVDVPEDDRLAIQQIYGAREKQWGPYHPKRPEITTTTSTTKSPILRYYPDAPRHNPREDDRRQYPNSYPQDDPPPRKPHWDRNYPRRPQNNPRNPQPDPRNPPSTPRNPHNDNQNPRNDPQYPQYVPRHPQYDPRNPEYDPRQPKIPNNDPKHRQNEPRYPQNDPRYDSNDPRYPIETPRNPQPYPPSTTTSSKRYPVPYPRFTTPTHPTHPRRHHTTPIAHHPRHRDYPRHRPTIAPKNIKPNTCNTNYDAIAIIRGELFIFKDKYLWRIGDRGVYAGYPHEISHIWHQLPKNFTHVDAVYENRDRKIVFFIGNQYYAFDSNTLARGYPKPLTHLGLPSSIQKIDAALIWGYNNKTYFYSGTLYWRFDEEEGKVELDYPRDMSIWRGIGYHIDTGFQYLNGKTYFFKGKGYWEFDDSRMQVAYVRTKPSAQKWMGCPRITNEVEEPSRRKSPLTSDPSLTSSSSAIIANLPHGYHIELYLSLMSLLVMILLN